MFEMLQNADRGTLVEVTYHVVQRFFERQRFTDAGMRRRRMVAAFGSEMSTPLLDLIEAVISEIEEREGTAFFQLSEEQFRPYWDVLDEMHYALLPESVKNPSEEDLRRIEEFRREYGLAA